MSEGEKTYVSRYLRIFLAVFLIIGGVWIVRKYVIGSYRISTDSMKEAVLAGDYVLVNKIQAKGTPGRNEVVLFYSPLQKDSAHPPIFLSRCVALPGDTIRKSGSSYRINRHLLPPSVGEIAPLTGDYVWTVPRKGRTYRLDSISIGICKEAILREVGARASFRDGKFFLDGRESTFYFFRNDYYWMVSDNPKTAIDSRYLGIIPQSHIIGTAWFCWYSCTREHFFKPIR